MISHSKLINELKKELLVKEEIINNMKIRTKEIEETNK